MPFNYFCLALSPPYLYQLQFLYCHQYSNTNYFIDQYLAEPKPSLCCNSVPLPMHLADLEFRVCRLHYFSMLDFSLLWPWMLLENGLLLKNKLKSKPFYWFYCNCSSSTNLPDESTEISLPRNTPLTANKLLACLAILFTAYYHFESKDSESRSTN